MRLAARAVVDLALHRGEMTLDEAAAFFAARGLMPAATARAEAVKTSMFPGTPLMYWLGTTAIHDLRRQLRVGEPGAPTLREFHDRFLSYGAIPVPLIARLMTARSMPRNTKHDETMNHDLALATHAVRQAERSFVCLIVFVPSCLRGHRVCSAAGSCVRASAVRSGPSNELLIVGYDREPDTLNRFSTHILEDIQTCVIEGLTITDDKMNIVPLLATEVPTLANGGVVLRPDGGMDVTWKLRPGVTWHDGTPFTSADVKFTVDAINDPRYNPESTDGFDRISSVDTPDPLTAVVHYKEVYAPYALQFVRGTLPRHVLEGRDIERASDYNRAPLGTGPYRVAEWKSGEYIRLERVTGLLARRRVPADQADPVSLRRQHQHAHQPAQDRRSAPGRDVPVGQAPRGRGDSRRDGPPHAWQRLRARHAQRAPRRRVQGRARPPRVDARDRPRR